MVRLFPSLRRFGVKLKSRIVKKNYVRRFVKSRSGNVAMMFGMTVIPILALAGGAVDYSAAINTRFKMRNALDAAALAAGRELQVTGSVDAAKQAAIDHFNATTDFSGITFATRPKLAEPKIDPLNGTIELAAAATVDTILLDVMGKDTILVTASSNAELQQGANGDRDLEISLMLDVTGSMRGDKLDALKSAAKDLVQIVVQEDSQGEHTSRVALAPFSTTINAGDYASAATGISQSSTLAPRLQLQSTPIRLGGLTVLPATSFGEGYEGFVSKVQWSWWRNRLRTTCVTERTGAVAYTDDAPEAGQYFPSVSDSDICVSPPVVPLTDNKTLLKEQIDAFEAGGWTAGHLGAAWSWYLVAPDWAAIWPSESTPGAYNTENLMKVVVLMTDGEFNTSYDGPEPNYQTKQLCDNMKDEGVVVYTVGFELDSQSARETLAYCATDSSKEFQAENSDQLKAAFREIAYELKELRLTK